MTHMSEGTAHLELPVPAELAEAAARFAARCGVAGADVLVAACTKVLAAMAGKPDLLVGYVAESRGQGAAPVACWLPVPSGTWTELVKQAAAVRPAPAANGAPSFETVIDLTGTVPADLPSGIATWVGFGWRGSRLRLRLRYRTAMLDAGAAARLAGYHLSALTGIVSAPDAAPSAHVLLSAEELRFQRDDLGGPVRELPGRRLHELFEDRVRRHPGAIAARCGDREWTYDQLNRQANRLAWSLLAAGHGHEDVVAVVTERNLDWMAAVLAIFKAGCAYLPVDPNLPAARIGEMLRRSGSRIVLTEPGSTTHLDEALADGTVAKILRGSAPADGDAADRNPGVSVGPGQLAYIFFTSGSTGQPKGAMCEHAGMLNHLLAKVEDLGLGSHDIVAQTAPQSFDISLWQLICALLVGGQTLIIGPDVISDVQRFAETLAKRNVTVAQVVPSYLDVLVAHLQRHPSLLPRLRQLVVTGEALKKELVTRWFAACPDIPLTNAYGLTETSDDTNHEVLTRPPDRDTVPLGRPVRNVTVTVVDEQSRPVPFGAPGEIVFSGVCVGRGYVNDPQRTRLAFGPDPAVPGGRRYRSGDFGRWLPDGKLEFLGRRDTQVKIRGFRIETGEVESHLLRLSGVRDAAVVAVDSAEGGKSLAAFHTGPRRASEIRAVVAATLPAYLVPDSFYRLDALPVTSNGKVDKKALAVLAGADRGSPAAAGEPVQAATAPATPSERRMAGAWAAVLGLSVELVTRDAHFFDLGGTSLSAIRLALRLDHAVSLPDVVECPVLTDLAARLDDTAARDEQVAV